MAKVGLILGVTGQDGSYLAQLLLRKGYQVIGVSRGITGRGSPRLETLGIDDKVVLRVFDSEKIDKLEACIRETMPNEIYNLAGPSSVGESFNNPRQTIQSIVGVTTNCLEIIRKYFPETKYYNAASSECFGNTGSLAADEMTSLRPVSPYGVAKSAVHNLAQVYRKTYDMFCCSGMLFNHESPLRSPNFVTQKIVAAVQLIARGEQDFLELGNLNVERDWGWAPEYTDAIYRIMQHRVPDDFVIATGQSSSLREIVRIAFSHVNLEWQKYVRTSDKYRRPTDIESSKGNPNKALEDLGWSAKYGLEEIITAMMKNETNY